MSSNGIKQQVKIEYEDGLLNYFKDLKKYKPLKREEERKLLIDYKENNDLIARQKLITSNLRYACSLVNKYSGRGIPISDLIEEANCGLIESIDKFDITKDVKVITYAKWNIEYKMQEAIRQKDKMPESELYENKKDDDEKNDIECFDNDVCEDELKDDDNFIDKPSFDDLDNNKVASTKMVENIMGVLNEKERDFITMYYGCGSYNKEHTYQEIGDKYHITKERVRQIIEKIMRKLRVQALILS